MVEIIEYGCCTDYIAGKERPLFDVRLFDLGEKRYAEEVKQALTYLRGTLTDLVVNYAPPEGGELVKLPMLPRKAYIRLAG